MLQVKVEEWQQGADEMEHLSRCARVCYGKDVAAKNPLAMAQRLVDKGHLSMLRHITYYYIIPFTALKESEHLQQVWRSVPCVGYVANKPEKRLYLAVNGQYWLEHNVDFHPFEQYRSEMEYFMRSWNTAWLVRYTFCMTTQISTTRELNRTSPNNIAEQSTRYVDMLSRMDDLVAEPHWYKKMSPFKQWVARMMYRCEGWFYRIARTYLGLMAQDARGFLPLDTASRVVYTYSASEWASIINLRYFEVTGPAHPNAILMARPVHDILTAKGYAIEAKRPRKYDLSAMMPSV